MNTLIFVPWDQERGGVASVVAHVARHLTARGYRVMFIHPGETTRPVAKTTKSGFPGVEMRLRAPFVAGRRVRSTVAFLLGLPAFLRELRRVVKANDIRVINVHYPTPNCVTFAVARWFLPVKLVVSVHGADLVPTTFAVRPSLAMRILLRAADLIVTPSAGYLAQCAGILPRHVPARPIHNGIDLNDLADVSGEPTPGVEPFVLAVATHDIWKGLDVLLRALARLRDAGTPIRAVLAGDGPLRGELEALTDDLALRDLVAFPGACGRAELARYLRDCAFVALPSRAESFGIAAVEAMSVGRAVVTTTAGGLPEVVEDRVNGLVVPPDNVEALAAAIHTLARDEALRTRLGEAGRRRARERFTSQLMGERYERAFASVVTGDANARQGIAGPLSMTQPTGLSE